MTQAEKQRETFLSVCGKHDYDLLTGKEAMTQAEFERITHITLSLGYSQYTQMLIATYLDFACKEAERTDREMDILTEYPSDKVMWVILSNSACVIASLPVSKS